MVPRPPGKGGAVQYFTYGPLEFNVNRAQVLAANAKKYRPECRRPAGDMVGPHIEVSAHYVEQSDLSKPVIFVTLVMEGESWQLLIDGNHRVLKALRHQTDIKAIVLDLEDTLKIMRGPEPMIQQMKWHGQRVGLLPAKA
jgi:hypothetical protein